jgi:hypothetical protein
MYPWAAFIFVGCLFTLIVGILNLITAVLVDNAAEARLNDTEARSQKARAEQLREKSSLAKMFESPRFMPWLSALILLWL